MNSKPAFSITQLGMLSRCGLQYQFRYCDGLIAPPSVAMVLGTATHVGIERNLREKKDTGKPVERGQALEAAGEALDQRWEEEVPDLTKAEKSRGGAAVRGSAKDSAIKLSGLHYDEVAPSLKPHSVERRFRIQTGGEVDLEGIIDYEDPYQSIDWKTGAKAKDPQELHDSIQMTAYALSWELDFRPEDGLNALRQVQFGVLVNTKTPKFQRLISHRGAGEYRTLLWTVQRAWEVVRSGRFMPAPTSGFGSPCPRCGYRSRCPAIRERSVHPTR